MSDRSFRPGEFRGLLAASFRPRHYWIGTAAWILYFAAPLVPGWFLGRTFDALEEQGASVRLFLLISSEFYEWTVAVCASTGSHALTSPVSALSCNSPRNSPVTVRLTANDQTASAW